MSEDLCVRQAFFGVSLLLATQPYKEIFGGVILEESVSYIAGNTMCVCVCMCILYAHVFSNKFLMYTLMPA